KWIQIIMGYVTFESQFGLNFRADLPILRILEGWQRARIARLSNLHSRTHNRSPPRLPPADVGDIAYAFDVLYTCTKHVCDSDEDTYDVVRSCQVHVLVVNVDPNSKSFIERSEERDMMVKKFNPFKKEMSVFGLSLISPGTKNPMRGNV
ncbi:hypothetical protein Tco_1036644, partial [Tanacetum coccineum]